MTMLKTSEKESELTCLTYLTRQPWVAKTIFFYNPVHKDIVFIL